MNLKSIQRIMWGCAAATMALTACQPQKSNLHLPALFADHMVLQQNSDVSFWGKANPGSRVRISADWGAEQTVKANADSTWLLKLATPAANGPRSVTIANDDSTLTIRNVLLGEVWLASGQSNMEMPLMGWPPNDTIQGSANAIATADYPDIRMFTVVRNVSVSPLADVVGSWQVCTPQNAPNFSATAFFFARRLHAELNVPVGIIHSSWGGTPAEAWVKGQLLAGDPDFAKSVADMEKVKPQLEVYARWLETLPSVNVTPKADGTDPIVGLDLFDRYCTDLSLDDQNWPKMALPTNVERTEVGDFDGAIWFRKQVEIPASWEGKELSVDLGPIDDRDVTYFNGVKIGAYEEGGYWQAKRQYTVPAGLVKRGKAVIAVRMIDTQGGGGMSGPADLMKLYPKGKAAQAVSLAGDWKYQVVAEYKQQTFYLVDPQTTQWNDRPPLAISVGPGTPAALYNAMIAPLVPYGIKGTIWYQGEANVGRAKQYVGLMDMLIEGWRNDFGNARMPFYFVQLAPWNYNDVKGNSSAMLRDAQRRTMAISHTGMVSTLDIGNVGNIHPCNKQDVGERLARWALANDYGKAGLAVSGPLFDQMEVTDGKAVLRFTNTDGGLRIETGVPNQFEIAGADGIFVPANVLVDGETLVVSSPGVKAPAQVRYAYTNGAEASLFNGAGLPAPSFTTEDELAY
ncbi:MAG: sialate O-acetylesterase [Breznakibacter sp.]